MAAISVQSEEILLQALKEILPQFRSSSNKQLEGKIGKEKFKEIASEIGEYVESGVNVSLTKNEQLALTIKILFYLGDYLKSTMNIPVTLNTLTTHLSLLPYAVDQCFPSYRESKLLRYIIVPQQLRA